MTKAFMGARLRRLREERRLSQTAAARLLGLSASYYNQLENDERPLTVPVLVKVSAAFGVDVQVFSEEEEARLIADMREALWAAAHQDAVSAAELREVAGSTPAIGRALVTMHRKLREAVDRADAMADRLGGTRTPLSSLPLMPFEEVRDFFYARHNYLDELDTAAEQLFTEAGLRVGDVASGLAERLTRRHRLQIVVTGDDAGAAAPQRKYEPLERRLLLSGHLSPGQRAFQMATQLAFLEFGDGIQHMVDDNGFPSDEARALARIGLANYFAGALLMPYRSFLEATESFRYDIDRLRQRFGVGFEVVCHRLSTLQRTNACGVPFFFIRVDRAGNISKRQSATDFHFSRVGGTCPLVERLRGLRAARPHPPAARADARRPDVPLDCADGLAGTGRIFGAEQDVRDRPRLRRAPRRATCLFERARPRGSNCAHADRRRLQGLRADRVSPARVPAHRGKAGRRRERTAPGTLLGRVIRRPSARTGSRSQTSQLAPIPPSNLRKMSDCHRAPRA